MGLTQARLAALIGVAPNTVARWERDELRISAPIAMLVRQREVTMLKNYEYRRGSIEVLDSSSGAMRCRECGATWLANLRGGGKYYRGSWTCFNCGASSKGAKKAGSR